VLLRAGSIYAALDLLGRHKRGTDFLTHAEVASLNMLKVLENLYTFFFYFSTHAELAALIMLKAPEGWGGGEGERERDREREKRGRDKGEGGGGRETERDGGCGSERG
jgi:hypothetical protein